MKVQTEVLRYTKDKDDPKKIVQDRVKSHVKGVELFGSRLLIATAPMPEASAGGILFADKTIDENRFQGKVGLVLKIGPGAFKYSGQYAYEGPVPKVGDWVFYRNSDTWECSINGVSCRFVLDDFVVGKVPSPDHIW